MENVTPYLMTSDEERAAVRVQDDSLFKEGLPSLISAAIEKTWAEPYILLQRLTGKTAENLLEPVARVMGNVAGKVLAPAFRAAAKPGDHVLEPAMQATRLAENATGIIGEDFYVNEKKVVRRVHTCPYKGRDGATILCHVGEAAGQELFAGLSPGIKHKVHVTMARGHQFCEYSYEID